MDRDKKDIYIFGQGVDLDTDKFGNSLSGIALKFLYLPLDFKCDHMERKFKRALTYPWSGADYSSRIWDNKKLLVKQLKKTVTQGIIQGKSNTEMVDILKETMGKGAFQSRRFIRTESMHIINAGQIDSYKKDDTKSPNYDIMKEESGNIIHILDRIKDKGPMWKPTKCESHLNKRKRKGHIPQDWSIEDYNNKIKDICSNFNNEVYLYYEENFSQKYYIFGDRKWIAMIGENFVMETASPPDRGYEYYLEKEINTKYIASIKEIYDYEK